jgi:hypothetical protein
MSRMTDDEPVRELPARVGSAAGLAVVDDGWSQVETDLAAVDARVRRLAAADRVDELARRRARRAERRALSPVVKGSVRGTLPALGGDAA